MNDALKARFDEHVEKGTAIQVKLRNDSNPQPYGPGKIERTPSTFTDAIGVVTEQDIYRILMPAMIQTTPNSKPQQIILPLVFAFEDVLFFSEPPQNVEGESAIMTPGGRRSPSGLHIGG